MALILEQAEAGAAEVLPFAGRLSPADKVIIGYLALIVLLAVSLSGSSSLSLVLTAGHAIGIGVILLAARSGDRVMNESILRFSRAWYPLALVPLTFKEMEFLVPRINPGDLDWQLASIDHRLFGVHPTIWLERLTHPVATEALQFAYISYYFLPLALGVPLWRNGRFREFHFLLFALVLGFYLSYLGYLAVPAIGPRFILNDQQNIPLTGVFIFKAVRSTLDWAEGITRDCFPSGHTAVAILVAYYARRLDHRIFWFILPIVTALVLSTVYLRYHYVIDVIGGGVLAASVVFVAGPLYRLLDGE